MYNLLVCNSANLNRLQQVLLGINFAPMRLNGAAGYDSAADGHVTKNTYGWPDRVVGPATALHQRTADSCADS